MAVCMALENRRPLNRRRVGRPEAVELAEVKKAALFKPSEWEEFLSLLPAGVKPGTYMHDIVMKAARGEPINVEMVGTDTFRVKLLTKANCGPWDEALEHAGQFVLSADIADELDAHDDDVIVRASGESMEAAGIPDGALVLMEPLNGRPPQKGRIALVQAVTADGEHVGTIKHWHPGSPPRLTDGEGNDFALPDDTVEVQAVAIARGVIGRL